MKTVQKIFSIKVQRGKTWKFSRVTDEHCGKNDINELYIWNYKIGLNN